MTGAPTQACDAMTPARMVWLSLGFQDALTNRREPSAILQDALNP